MEGAIAVIARGFRSLWLGNSAANRQHPLASRQGVQRGSSRSTVDREAAKRGYSFEYTNGLQTIRDARSLQFPSDRAARRGAMRTARDMANDISWQSSARGRGWTVRVINPTGQQVCEVPVRRESRFARAMRL